MDRNKKKDRSVDLPKIAELRIFFSQTSPAQVAELADALGSGPSSLNRECRFDPCPGHLKLKRLTLPAGGRQCGFSSLVCP